MKNKKKTSLIIQTTSKQIKITTVGWFLWQNIMVFTNDPKYISHYTSLHVFSLNFQKKTS